MLDSYLHKVQAIEQAQAAGTVTATLRAPDLLVALLALSSMWATTTPEYLSLAADQTVEQRRQVVVDSVTRLLAG